MPIGIGGKQVASPFRLTPEGQALGFQDSVNGIGTNDDINCCPTHNSFQEPPAGSALKVAERDSSVPPAPETLFADGTISGGTIVNKPTFGKVVGLPSNRKCVSRRKFRIRIRQPGGIKIQTALVFVNGKKVRVLTRKVFQKKRKVAGRQPARAAEGRLQGADRGADDRGHDPPRHPHLPDLHEEAQVQAPAEALVTEQSRFP